MLALAELRTDDQIEADAEIDRDSRDERDELVIWFQRAAAETASFLDLWFKRNNLPAPPSPFAYVMEMMGRDLVAEEFDRVLSRQVITRRRKRKGELRVLATESQLSLL